MCLLPDGIPVLAYNESIYETGSLYKRIVINKIVDENIFEKEITQSKCHAAFPVLISTKNSKIIVAWNDNDRIFYSILDANKINSKVINDKYSTGNNAISYSEPNCGMQ